MQLHPNSRYASDLSRRTSTARGDDSLGLRDVRVFGADHAPHEVESHVSRRRPGSFLAALACFASVALSVPAGAVASGAAASVTAAPAAAVAPPAQDRMPGDVPSKSTPGILDGQVYKVAQVGNTMVAGGTFTQVADPMNGTPYTRQNLVAFDATTGLVSQTFNPTVDGQSSSCRPARRPAPSTLPVTSQDHGKGPNHLQLLDVSTGLAVSTFRAPSTSGGIHTIELLPNNRLFVGGNFTTAGGAAHGGLMSLNATTGALDPYINNPVARRHNDSGSGAQGAVGVRDLGVTPGRQPARGDRQLRGSTGSPATRSSCSRCGPSSSVTPDWQTNRYSPYCFRYAFDTYMRGVSSRPTGATS